MMMMMMMMMIKMIQVNNHEIKHEEHKHEHGWCAKCLSIWCCFAIWSDTSYAWALHLCTSAVWRNCIKLLYTFINPISLPFKPNILHCHAWYINGAFTIHFLIFDSNSSTIFSTRSSPAQGLLRGTSGQGRRMASVIEPTLVIAVCSKETRTQPERIQPLNHILTCDICYTLLHNIC